MIIVHISKTWVLLYLLQRQDFRRFKIVHCINFAPINSTNNDLPKRTWFSWVIRTVPRTDGWGIQEDHGNAVKIWPSFYNQLVDSDYSRIPKVIRGILLHSHLYGRTKDVAKTLYSLKSSLTIFSIRYVRLYTQRTISLFSSIHTTILWNIFGQREVIKRPTVILSLVLLLCYPNCIS